MTGFQLLLFSRLSVLPPLPVLAEHDPACHEYAGADLFHDTHQKRGKLTLSQIAAPLFPNINPPRVTPVRLPDRLAGIGTIFRFDNQVDVVMTCFNIVDSYQQVIKKIIVSKAVTLQSMLNFANGKTSW